jgi:hypothetical protein
VALLEKRGFLYNHSGDFPQVILIIPSHVPNNHRKTLLKVPKRENFSLAFFAQSEPTWVCDLGSGEKNRIFYQMTPVFDGFWFFAAY